MAKMKTYQRVETTAHYFRKKGSNPKASLRKAFTQMMKEVVAAQRKSDDPTYPTIVDWEIDTHLSDNDNLYVRHSYTACGANRTDFHLGGNSKAQDWRRLDHHMLNYPCLDVDRTPTPCWTYKLEPAKINSQVPPQLELPLSPPDNCEIRDVKDFHEKFKLDLPSSPMFMDNSMFQFRFQFLLEELTELLSGHREGNLTKIADALADLIYVAYGTALLFGIHPETWQKVWAAVQKANMSKVRVKSAKDSKRKSDYDVVKPKGWKGPEETITQVLLHAQEEDE